MAVPKLEDEISNFFDALTNDNKPYDYADSVIKKIEDEYLPTTPGSSVLIPTIERAREKRRLKIEQAGLYSQLASNKNVKNPRLTKVNDDRAKKRATIKAKIEKIKDRLYQIELEEQGSNIGISDAHLGLESLKK